MLKTEYLGIIMPRDVRKNKDFLYKNEKNIKNK